MLQKRKVSKYLPYLISTSSLGKIRFIAKPPLMYQFTRVLELDNKDPEHSVDNLSIVDAILCNSTYNFYVIDEKGFLKCFNFSNIVEKLKNSYEEYENSSSKTTLKPPSFYT